MPKPPRIAIVGGGLAGLAAAVELADKGLHVELLEARRNLGGRAGSWRDPASGELVDHCQHVSLGCCTAWLDFCQRTGLDAFTRRDNTLCFIAPDGRAYRLRATRWLPAPLHLAPALLRMTFLTWPQRLGIIRAMQQLERMPQHDDPAGPTIDVWLREQGQTDSAIDLFWTPIIVSALSETLDRVGIAPVRKVFVDSFLRDRRAYELVVPTVALGELYGERLENWLAQHGIVVRRECAVRRVHGTASGVEQLELASGEHEPFDAVVLAAPWRRVGELVSPPIASALPELAALEQIESAPITAVHLWFDRPITALPHAVLPGRTSQWLFNRGQSGERGFHYQVVISASRNLESLPRHHVVATVLGELKEIWPEAGEAKLLQSQMITEQHAVFSVLPGIDRLRPPQQTKIPNLFLAGDWTATGWPATMEGAVRSGYAAAKAVSAAIETGLFNPAAR